MTAGAEPAFGLYPKDRVVLYPRAQKAASEISSDFLHKPKIEPRVASFLLGKNRIHLMQLCIPQTILLPPTSLTQEVAGREIWLIRAKGFLHLKVWSSALDQEAILPVSISPDGF